MKGNKTHDGKPLRVLYLGSHGRLTATPLNILLDHHVHICAMMVAASYAGKYAIGIRPVLPEPVLPHMLPVSSDANPVQVSHHHHVPVYEIGKITDPAAKETMRAFKPDLILTSCFPMRLPQAILDIPALGCFNLHPALLPNFRGPDPLFWIFYHGTRQTGVTVHRMTTRLDAGDIVAQAAWDMAPGMSEESLLAQCAESGGRLFIEVIAALEKGPLAGQPQNEAQSSYFSWPDHHHRVITPARPAQWAYNFIRGVGKRSTPLELYCDGMRYQVKEAMGYTASGRMNHPKRRGDHLWVPCNPGTLHITGYRIAEVDF